MGGENSPIFFMLFHYAPNKFDNRNPDNKRKEKTNGFLIQSNR